tara:strand:- start:1352 stop:1585 length:234 start_codon:yes stop_codon:yes gene_type:complete
MAFKVLGSAVTNPSDNNIGRATAVSVHVTSTQTCTVKNAGGTTLGTISLPAGIHKIIKDATDTIAVTGSATQIAHTD